MALGRVGLEEFQALDITAGLLQRGMEIEQHLPKPLLFHDSPKFIYADFTSTTTDLTALAR